MKTQEKKRGIAGMRLLITVKGTVQGVGFRPFVYRLATGLNLAGSVRNTGDGVEIVVQGPRGRTGEFLRRLREDAPPLARLREVAVRRIPPETESGFHIEVSSGGGASDIDAARDVATCDACLAEMRDPADRRYRHPFINCTDCGPRYTIIESLPYDRPTTSMKKFPMCPECAAEYGEPGDRRFHAQPVCCPRCGPRLELCDAAGGRIATNDPIGEAARLLASGGIVAVKGIGGFHLACDATSSAAVSRLRQRKHREEKPLAVMVRDLAAVRRIARVSPSEQALLESPERPIVLLAKTDDGTIAAEVAPRSRFHGLMLPYSPIHHLLTERLPYLVMTSGNRTEEPIARTNDEAIANLRGIADMFLLHDRDILARADDSIVRETTGDVMMLRRSRGYVPEPIAVAEDITGIVACGPMLKSCVAVGRGSRAYLSQHIGDLVNAEAYRSLEQTATRLCAMLGVVPQLAACDLHPGYPSTRFAESLGVPVARVQHHHAHVAACMAENGLAGPVIGVAFDGTGHGTEGHTWGSEVLVCKGASFERLGHLKYMTMPGGDAAVRHPCRMAVGALFPLLGRDAATAVSSMNEEEASAVLDMLAADVNCPLTCGMGRLFDAASALLGVCTRATYEGQPAAELEGVADPSAEGCYPVQLHEHDGVAEVDGAGILMALCDERDAGQPVATLAGRFHNTIVEALVRLVAFARERTGIGDVCLTGGCFQNVLLLEKSIAALERAGFVVHRHRLVPPNDGGVALGQLVIAATRKG